MNILAQMHKNAVSVHVEKEITHLCVCYNKHLLDCLTQYTHTHTNYDIVQSQRKLPESG